MRYMPCIHLDTYPLIAHIVPIDYHPTEMALIDSRADIYISFNRVWRQKEAQMHDRLFEMKHSPGRSTMRQEHIVHDAQPIKWNGGVLGIAVLLALILSSCTSSTENRSVHFYTRNVLTQIN